MDPLVVDNLVNTAEEIWRGPLAPTMPSGARHPLRQIVAECMRRKLQVSAVINSSGRGNAAVFVGPPGAGKSTAIAKLAVHQCLSRRRSVRIVSIDTDRVGGHERLRVYAGIMGIGFNAVNSLAELRDAMHETRGKDYVLIDTPGYSAGDAASAHDLALALEGIDGREVHLVLPASMKCADLARCSDFYAIFKPGRLLFTKLDETVSVGSVVSEALRLEKPLSFFATGQGVPEDLEEADLDVLTGRMFPGEAALIASAA
jgi:flagellar biosynthesis protein FlhF